MRCNFLNTPTWRRSAPGSILAAIAVLAGCMFTGSVAQAQAPVNLLRFTFNDAGPGTTTPSDTSLGGVSVNMNMLNGAGAAADFHGAAGSGVSGALDGNRGMDFSNQTNQPGGSNPGAGTATGTGPIGLISSSATLGFGSITSFVATVWIKQTALMALSGGNVNIGPRLWILNAGAPVDGGGSANTISLKFQAANQLYFQFGADTVTVGPAFTSNLATNKWLFFAVVYDGTTAKLYSGSETAAAQLVGTATSVGRVLNLGTSASLSLGNRATNRQRGLNGFIDDFQFYMNAGDAAFVENVRQIAVGGAPAVTGVSPDGLLLEQGTNNTLSFTASSPSGAWGPSVAITNVQMVLNGVDVSAQLVKTGPTTNLTVTYTGLALDKATNTASITVIDAKGLTGTAQVSFDTFNPANFTWEAEEFDFSSGSHIDNPIYSSVATNNSYFGLDSSEGVDTHKGTGNAGVNASDYRAGAVDATRTQTPQAFGEQQRQKFLTAIGAGDSNVVDHVVGNWASADWENYTKTFPAGLYNVYGRLAAGAGSATVTLSLVTSGQGTGVQTLTNLGTFTPSGANYNLYQYAPLRDSFGNLAVVNLAGLKTLRVTTGGGANANFYMLVPANTNLPSITAVYPDGLVLFEPTNRFKFTVSSSATINTNSIQLTLNGTNVSSSLVFSGSTSSWNVSYTGLVPSQSYTAGITVTDGNGNTASSTVNFDTYNPTTVWEAEDFDFNGGQHIDNPVPTTGPAANSYFGLVGTMGVDEFNGNAVPPYAGASPNNYRASDPIATTLITDAARQNFLTANAPDYNVGFLGGGFWENYTRTFPAGTYNIYTRAARGDPGAANINVDQITGGWGTTAQFMKRIGTFAVPGGLGWSAYRYVPLKDTFGNYANVTLGSTNTLRTTELLPVNINFYMLTAARTDLARIDNVYPDGTTLMQGGTNTFSFIASSPTYGIVTSNIVVTMNAVNVSSNLVFTGSSTNWNVSYPGLLPSRTYTAVITVTDTHTNVATTTVSFDTFNPGNFTWEAEDYDFTLNGLSDQFIDNPVPTSTDAPNSYFNQVSTPGIDENYLLYTGGHVYRPSDYIATEVTGDGSRQRFLTAQLASLDPTIVDHDVYFWTNAAWINYTHTYPTGKFQVYARLSGGNGAFNLQCAQVTSGVGTNTQTTQNLGTFKGTGASFATWQWVQLINTNTSQPVVLSLGGVSTFQMTADGNENANFYMLVPIANVPTLSVTPNGASVILSIPTQAGFTYSLEYKNNITDANWTVLSTVTGDGSVKTANDAAVGTSRFYRVGVH